MGSTDRIFFFSLICAAAMFFGTADAATQEIQLTPEQKQEAKGYFVTGSQNFADKEYEKAIEQFRKAFDIVRLPEIIFNIGRCYEELGQTEEAITNYEMYLHFYPDASDAEEVKVRIKILKAEEQSRNEEEDEEETDEEETDEFGPKPDSLEEPGFGLGAEIGGAATLTGADKSPSLPIGIVADYFVVGDWLAVTGGIEYGYYFNKKEMNDPRNHWILEAGGRGVWTFAKNVSVVTRLCLSYAWITYRTDGANWLAGRATAGLGYLVSDRWRLSVDGSARIGAMFGDKYNRNVSKMRIEIGAVAGAEYLF